MALTAKANALANAEAAPSVTGTSKTKIAGANAKKMPGLPIDLPKDHGHSSAPSSREESATFPMKPRPIHAYPHPHYSYHPLQQARARVPYGQPAATRKVVSPSGSPQRLQMRGVYHAMPPQRRARLAMSCDHHHNYHHPPPPPHFSPKMSHHYERPPQASITGPYHRPAWENVRLWPATVSRSPSESSMEKSTKMEGVFKHPHPPGADKSPTTQVPAPQLASKEKAAIDAMLALGSRSSSDSEETKETSSCVSSSSTSPGEESPSSTTVMIFSPAPSKTQEKHTFFGHPQ